MGVTGLKTYLDGKSLGVDVKLTEEVLVDGHSLAHMLYFRLKIQWTLGGEYAVYREEVAAFLAHLGRVCQVTVLMDGAPPGSKRDERLRRMQQRLQYCHQAAKAGFSPPISNDQVIAPWAIQVFVQTVRAMPSIALHVCDGEADGVIARLSQASGATMLSNDSDFFIYGGTYAPLYSLRLDAKAVWARIYSPGALADHLGFSRALLPAFATLRGSDYVDDDISRALHARLALEHPEVTGHGSIRAVLLVAKFLRSHGDATSALEAAIHLLSNDTAMRDRASAQFKVSIAQYHQDCGTSQSDATGTRILLQKIAETYSSGSLTPWIREGYQAGTVSYRIIEILLQRTFWADPFLAHPKLPGPWQPSQGLRAQLYGVCLGAGASVTEYLASGQVVSARAVVTPKTLATMEDAQQAHPRRKLQMLVAMAAGDQRKVHDAVYGLEQAYIIPVLAVHVLAGDADRVSVAARLWLRKFAMTTVEANALLTSLVCTCKHSARCHDDKPAPRAVHLSTAYQFTLHIVALLNQALGIPLPDVDAATLLSGHRFHTYFAQTTRNRSEHDTKKSLCGGGCGGQGFGAMLDMVGGVAIEPTAKRKNRSSKALEQSPQKKVTKSNNIYQMLVDM